MSLQTEADSSGSGVWFLPRTESSGVWPWWRGSWPWPAEHRGSGSRGQARRRGSAPTCVSLVRSRYLAVPRLSEHHSCSFQALQRASLGACGLHEEAAGLSSGRSGCFLEVGTGGECGAAGPRQQESAVALP